MAIKGYSAFTKAPASLEPHHQIVQGLIKYTYLVQSVGKGQIVFESDGNEGVLYIPEISPAGASPSDCLIYLGYSIVGGGS